MRDLILIDNYVQKAVERKVAEVATGVALRVGAAAVGHAVDRASDAVTGTIRDARDAVTGIPGKLRHRYSQERDNHASSDNYWFGIVDGTGANSNDQYRIDMQNSFCSQIAAATNSTYMRGPADVGLETGWLADWIVSRIMDLPKETRVLLAGYSRGGSAVVLAAMRLRKQDKDRRIDHMFLFDPVARHPTTDTETVPGNVNSLHFIRRMNESDGIAAEAAAAEYDGALNFWEAGHNPFREWFGNTATREETGANGVRHVRRGKVLGSHGALGGVGWGFVTQDDACQKLVAGFMNKGLEAAGIDPVLANKGVGTQKMSGGLAAGHRETIRAARTVKTVVKGAVTRGSQALQSGGDWAADKLHRTGAAAAGYRDRAVNGIRNVWSSFD